MVWISENIDRSDVSQLRDVLVALKDTTLGQTHQMPQLFDNSHLNDHCLTTLFPERISAYGYQTIAEHIERMLDEETSNLLIPKGSVSLFSEVTGTSVRWLLESLWN